jgi:hypothetical protein
MGSGLGSHLLSPPLIAEVRKEEPNLEVSYRLPR